MPKALVFPGGKLGPEDGSAHDDAAWERAARRECLEEAGFEPRCELVWFDTWTTPSGESSRRFTARFFCAQLRPDEGHEAVADGFETTGGRWASADEHLQSWRDETVDLPPPTLCTLLLLRACDDLGALRDRQPHDTILPKVWKDDGATMIVMPHDPDYPKLPGEQAPAPARVHALPKRFIRRERTWEPCE